MSQTITTTVGVLFIIIIGFIVLALQYHHSFHNFQQTNEVIKEEVAFANTELSHKPVPEPFWNIVWSDALIGNGPSSSSSFATRVKRRIWLNNETLPGVSSDNSSTPAVTTAPASANGSSGSNDTIGGAGGNSSTGGGGGGDPGATPSKPRGYSIIRLLNKNYTLIKERFFAAVANGTLFPNGTLVNPPEPLAINGTAVNGTEPANNGTTVSGAADGNSTTSATTTTLAPPAAAANATAKP